MIAEPYICIKGFKYKNGRAESGAMEWFCNDDLSPNPENWRPYADFEREKLLELFKDRKYGKAFQIANDEGYSLMGYTSDHLICYTNDQHWDGSESSRLLKRAEFLKAVCEKEGVEWLPKDCCCEPNEPCKAHGTHDPKKCKYCGHSTDRYDPCCEKWIDDQDRARERDIVDDLCGDGKLERDYYTKAETSEWIERGIKLNKRELNDHINESTNSMHKIADLLNDLPDLLPASRAARMLIEERVKGIRESL